jgi:hypothetical protein
MSVSLRMYLSKDEPFGSFRHACPERSVFDRLRPSVEGLTTSEVSQRISGPRLPLTASRTNRGIRPGLSLTMFGAFGELGDYCRVGPTT